MRKILGIVGALLFVGSAQSAPMWNDHIGHWFVGAYSDDKVGGFSHCAASANYQNGILLLFSVAKNFTWSIAFANPKWNIRPGTQYNVSYWVDNGPAEFATPTALRDDIVTAVLPEGDACPYDDSGRISYSELGSCVLLVIAKHSLDYFIIDTVKEVLVLGLRSGLERRAEGEYCEVFPLTSPGEELSLMLLS
jgi:hypothetical protein